jgi:Zn-dependent protease with chaperone function
MRRKVVAWSVIAVAVLILAAVFGVPVLADRLTPLLPLRAERTLGAAVDGQVRRLLDKSDGKQPFECGEGSGEALGRAALEKLIGRLEAAAALPIPLDARVVRREEPNAVALPGGRIYVFAGLINQAENADEVAGVIAHEIGHVAHRDGTRSILQSAGLSFLFGMLLGDFVGGGAVIVAARTVLQSSYSREQEAAADAYGVELMRRAGGDLRALGTLLGKIGGATEPGMKILRDHPDTNARIAAINRVSPPGAPAAPFISNEDWASLRGICKG